MSTSSFEYLGDEFLWSYVDTNFDSCENFMGNLGYGVLMVINIFSRVLEGKVSLLFNI